MQNHQASAPRSARNPILSSLADERRRRTLAILCDRSAPVSEQDLATHIVADEQDSSLVDVTADAVRSVRVSLRHVHLPALDDVDVVDWDSDAATVATTDHPALQDPQFQTIVETMADGWDAVVEALADQRRRVVLSMLRKRNGAVSLDELVRTVHDRELDAEVRPEPANRDKVRQSLFHVHLPKLDEAGLVSYDADAGTAAFEGHASLDDSWLTAVPGETPRAIVSAAHQTEDIWTLEGRDYVTERGRALCDYADEELFTMFTTEGLIEGACIDRLRAAVDRGVDVYVGSQDADLRDLVREEAPGATIWEPQMDWLNLPPNQEKVGRLILADREAIMVGTLGEQTDRGVHEETAITGTGENNAVVMLVRDMLGQRLDHLDAQSEDFRSQIPL